MSECNPIRSVDGVTVQCPSSYVWKLEDVSSSDAGRSEDGLMHKERVGQAISIELAWKGLSTAEASAVLRAFDPEYITVVYLDPKEGDYVARTFYVGNRSAPLYNVKLDLWENIAFNIISRGV